MNRLWLRFENKQQFHPHLLLTKRKREMEWLCSPHDAEIQTGFKTSGEVAPEGRLVTL